MDPEYSTPTHFEISSQLKASTKSALEANKAHQYALTKHAERLIAELQKLDELMDSVATEDIEDETDAEVQIPGAVKATGPCPVAEFLKPDSPFHEDASRRSQYLSETVDHPMKNKELEALEEAVKRENLRLKAYASQQSGQSDTEFDVENNTEGINWSIVAENVNKASSSTNRTANQCRVRWLGDRHPRINHDSWSPSELENLKNLVSVQAQTNEGKVNWVQVANELGTNRTPIDCMRHGVQRQRHIWNAEADKRLSDAVKLYGTYNWNIVARYVSEDATASQCQARYSRAIDPSRKRGAWSDDELARLKEAVAAYGNSWVDVAACIPGRTNEQCRERWSEHLNLASVDTVWTEEDDLALTRAVAEVGNRWKEISAKVGNGTTSQQCRTRWEKLKRSQEQERAATAVALESQPSVPKPTGRTRKKIKPAGTQAQEENTASVPSKRPRPRPIGKNKGKAKVVEPSAASAIELAPGPTPDQKVHESDATTEAGAGKKRVWDETGEEVEAPVRKRRKTMKSKAVATLPPKKDERPRRRAATASSSAVADASPDIVNDANTTSSEETLHQPILTRLRTRTKPISVDSPADTVSKSPAHGIEPDVPTSSLQRTPARLGKRMVSPESDYHDSDDGDESQSGD